VCGKKSIKAVFTVARCLFIFGTLGFYWQNPWPYAVFARSAIRAKQAYLLDCRAGMKRVGEEGVVKLYQCSM